LSALRLKLDLNFFSLLPSDNGSIQSFLDVTQATGMHSLVIALIEMPPGQSREKSEALIEGLAGRMTRLPHIGTVEYKITATTLNDLLGAALYQMPLFMKEGVLDGVADRLSDRGIEEQIARNKRLLMTPFGVAAKDFIHADPLGLSEIVADCMPVHTAEGSRRPGRGFFTFDEGRTYLVFVKPEEPPQDISFSKNLMKRLNGLIVTAVPELAGTLGIDAGKIDVSYTGGYAIAVSDEAMTRKDIKTTVLTSLIGILLLFGLAFRTGKVLLCVGLSLVVSLILTMGFAGIVFHRLNVLTCIFSCVLIGLGIDFAIHFVNRYFSGEKRTMEISLRLKKTFSECGAGILIGAVTTATAFYAIALSDFRGFRELGIMTGTGILLCMAVMLIVLPSMLLWLTGEGGTTRIVVKGFGMQSFIGRLMRYPWTITVCSLVTIVVLSLIGYRVTFDDNLRNFRAADHEVFRLQERVASWMGGSMGKIFLVIRDEGELQAMEVSARASKALDELRQEGIIAGFRSINQYLASPKEQEHNQTLISQQPAAFDMKRIRSTFYRALDKNGFARTASYDRYMDHLSRAFSRERVFLPSSLPDGEKRRYIASLFSQREGVFSSIIHISPSRDLWGRSETDTFVDAIRGKLEHGGVGRSAYTLTGSSILSAELRGIIMDNLRQALWWACLGILFVLLIYYRKPAYCALAILPVMLGMTVLTGIMVIFRIDFNFLNIIVVPMIAGIGIDDGVHLANTFRGSGDKDILPAITLTARAVLLTSLTTLVGFGSIILAHYPGLQSMGYVAVIGIAACLVISLLVMPPLFCLLRSRRQGPPR